MKTTIKSFKINEYLTLKLEDKQTKIYIDNEFFDICKRLPIEVYPNDRNKLSEIKSIDEVIEKSYLSHDIKLKPEVEFWVHCSNLQAWVEHKYDTRLLDMRLAFPILKKLADLGDTYAKVRFAEEVVTRYNKGNDNVREFLVEGNYFDYIEGYDYYHDILNPEDAVVIAELASKYKRKIVVESSIPIYPMKKICFISIKNRQIYDMGLKIDRKLPIIPPILAHIKGLRRLKLYIDENIKKLKSEAKFDATKYLAVFFKAEKRKQCEVDIMESFPSLIDVGYYSYHRGLTLNFSKNKSKFNELGGFELENINIEKEPFNHSQTPMLKELSFKKCKIDFDMEFITKFPNLEWLIVQGCEISHLPNKLDSLKCLEVVDIFGTNINSVPSSLLKHQNIKYFKCSPDLLTEEVIAWIDELELKPYLKKAWRKVGFFNNPV